MVGTYPIEKIVRTVDVEAMKKRSAPYVIKMDISVPTLGTATEKDDLKHTLEDSVEMHTPTPGSTSTEGSGEIEIRKWWSE